MNVLFATLTLYTGGAELFMLRLARKMSQKGNNVSICIIQYNKEFELILKEILGEELNRIKIITLFHPWSKHQPPVWIDRILWRINGVLTHIGYMNFRNKANIRIQKNKLVRFIRKNKISVVSTHLWETDCFFSELPSVKYVISMHGCYERHLYNILQNGSERIFDREYRYDSFIEKSVTIMNKSHGIIYVAEKNLEINSKVHYKGLMRKIYYGYEKPEPVISKVKDDSRFRIGMFARGIESKGWQLLIESFMIVQKELEVDIELNLVYVESEYMKSLRSKYGSIKNIKFLGFIKDPHRIISDWDFVVFPSFYHAESLPNTIIESLACGKAVVATDIGEIKAMLTTDNGMAGQIIQMDENRTRVFVKEIAAAIMNYIHNPELLMLHCNNALRASEKFNMELCAANYEKMFLEATMQEAF